MHPHIEKQNDPVTSRQALVQQAVGACRTARMVVPAVALYWQQTAQQPANLIIIEEREKVKKWHHSRVHSK